eukprot:5938756-Ditylum_brightwellii.AAC.1
MNKSLPHSMNQMKLSDPDLASTAKKPRVILVTVTNNMEMTDKERKENEDKSLLAYFSLEDVPPPQPPNDDFPPLDEAYHTQMRGKAAAKPNQSLSQIEKWMEETRDKKSSVSTTKHT